MEELIRSFLRETSIRAVNELPNIINRLKEVGTEIDIDRLKILWNYQEQNSKIYSFDEVKSWIKDNMDSSLKKACIYKEEESDKIKLHICFMDNNDNILLEGDYPHKVVNTLELDNVLLDYFTNRDLIILG
jgi:hypothetical protein